MRLYTRSTSIALLAATASLSAAQQRPPIRQLGAVTARSVESLSSVASVRALSTRGVLVNDPANRRVILLDRELKSFIVVADSSSATGNAYSGRTGGLIAYRGDSTLFVDPQSLSMMVIDPAGRIGRVMSVPRSEDAQMLAGAVGGAAFDGKGALIYRTSPRFQMGGAGPRTAGFVPPQMPDSAAIVRIDLATRKLDTVTYIKTPKIRMDVAQEGDRVSMTSQINPLPVVDDWGVLSDGSVAIVRGRDYHVDVVTPQGVKSSFSKIPFDWQRLTDEDKVAFIDSVKAARARMGASAPNLPFGGVGAAQGSGGGGGGGGPQIMIVTGPPAGSGEGGPQRDAARTRQAQMTFVPASELPDYKPAFFAGAVRTDTDGNIWIRTIPTSAIPGGPVYDVVNSKGEIVERVQIPVGRTLIGFGSGTVYMTARENDKIYLEAATIR
ncbi:MAG: hypothetical protein H0T48_03550 [Gemmatimonadaceae bacterium]|nr:hypothetical protein [Gemmatimonadaceae bacterium]